MPFADPEHSEPSFSFQQTISNVPVDRAFARFSEPEILRELSPLIIDVKRDDEPQGDADLAFTVIDRVTVCGCIPSNVTVRALQFTHIFTEAEVERLQQARAADASHPLHTLPADLRPYARVRFHADSGNVHVVTEDTFFSHNGNTLVYERCFVDPVSCFTKCVRGTVVSMASDSHHATLANLAHLLESESQSQQD